MILVDADACPVREETYRVARRHGVSVTVVSNSYLRTPREPGITFQLVTGDFDAADDWIAERAGEGSIVVTSDILLAERCVKAGARVLAPNGRETTLDSIGAALAARAIMADLRAGADQTAIGGPPPFTQRDRSRFLEALHLAVERLKRS